MPGQTFEIRDLRQQDWLWTSKALLYHPEVDASMYKTYAGLSSYANNLTQKAFPSLQTLAEKLHMGRMTVVRAMAKLEAMKFVSVERMQGLHNIYTMLDVAVSPKMEMQSPEPPKEKPPATEFQKFWGEYPNKIDKARAEKSWNKIIQTTTVELIMRGLRNHKESEQWTKDDGRFVPHPTTWLNNKRWEIVMPKARPPEKKPFYKGDPVVEKDGQRFVIVKGEWLKFAGNESEIEYKLLTKSK